MTEEEHVVIIKRNMCKCPACGTTHVKRKKKGVE